MPRAVLEILLLRASDQWNVQVLVLNHLEVIAVGSSSSEKGMRILVSYALRTYVERSTREEHSAFEVGG